MTEQWRPVVLDFDRSVGALDHEHRIALDHWQEALRFGCTAKVFESFSAYLEPRLPTGNTTVLMGSGDYHHVSALLVQRMQARQPFDVVVFDNHPDNMRFPFGIHCGSWVRRVALLPQVRHVHVIGISSSDIGVGGALNNYWQPLLRGKLTYWCLGVDVGWARLAGLGQAFRRFDDPDLLMAAFLAEPQTGPVYLSIDKDVFAPDVVKTNWDQGRLQAAHVIDTIHALAGRLIGSDITGEVSVWRYRTWWKRWLSALDAQPDIPPAELAQWQAHQHALNRQLLTALQQAQGQG